MRAIGLLAILVVGPAHAEPKPKPAKPAKKVLPDIVKEAAKATPPRIKLTPGPLGIDGTIASGIVVDPPDHPDARPYPDGMVIEPPDPNDPMNLELGTNELHERLHREPWLPRDLSLRFKRGADQVWDVLIPKI